MEQIRNKEGNLNVGCWNDFFADLTSLATEKEDARRKTEERKIERQKTIEAKRAAKRGPMKLGAKKAAFD